MNSNMNRYGRLIITATLLLLLCSCANGDAHATVHMDRSVDLDVKITTSNYIINSLNLQKTIDHYVQSLEQRGLQIESRTENGRESFQINHTFSIDPSDHNTNIIETLQKLAEKLPKGMTLSFAVNKHFFTTDYQLQWIANFLQMLPDSNHSLTDKLTHMNFIAKKLLFQQLNFSFDLTLPIRPLAHNADRVSDHGKTLTWDISPLSENRLELALRVPNLKRIAAVAAAVSIAVIIVVLFWWRRRKNRSKQF